jgi:molybdate transport system regulatory protein
MPRHVRASLSLEGRIGRADESRIALLEAIHDTGSISGAARKLGISYRAAWDGVQILNNLFLKPLVTAGSGGKAGGGASITSEGAEVIAGYRRMQTELRVGSERLERDVAGAHRLPDIWMLSLRTTARNALAGTITKIIRGAVNSEVWLAISEDATLVAVVTNESVRELGLARGKPAVALINPSWIIIARENEVGKTSARNRLTGIVSERQDGAVNSRITISIGNGKSLSAVITRTSSVDIDLSPGEKVCALIKASHVILLAQ